MISSTNPATGETLQTYPSLTPAQREEKLALAHRTFLSHRHALFTQPEPQTMPRNRRAFEPRPSDNGPRRRNAIGIAAVVLAALAWWAWMGSHSPGLPPAPPAPSALVRIHR